MQAILEHLNHFVTSTIADYGIWAIFLLMLLESACIPIPSEVTMLYAGYIVTTDDATFVGIVTAGVLGNVVGSLLIYAVGASGGRALLLHHGRWIGVKAKHVDHADRWFEQHGNAAAFFGRLIPIVRTFISLPAGVARMPVVPFSIYTMLGCIPFVAALAAIGVALGPHWERAHSVLHYADYAIAAIILATIVWFALRWRAARRAATTAA